VESYVVAERFEKVLKMLRTAMSEMELEVAGEIDGKSSQSSKTLLVDCPLLNFEALALNRAAAVFFPLHVVVSPVGGHTRISVANPTKFLKERVPIGAADPIARLMARVELALESVADRLAAGASR
jgi:hypothetical protein